MVESLRLAYLLTHQANHLDLKSLMQCSSTKIKHSIQISSTENSIILPKKKTKVIAISPRIYLIRYTKTYLTLSMILKRAMYSP